MNLTKTTIDEVRRLMLLRYHTDLTPKDPTLRNADGSCWLSADSHLKAHEELAEIYRMEFGRLDDHEANGIHTFLRKISFGKAALWSTTSPQTMLATMALWLRVINASQFVYLVRNGEIDVPGLDLEALLKYDKAIMSYDALLARVTSTHYAKDLNKHMALHSLNAMYRLGEVPRESSIKDAIQALMFASSSSSVPFATWAAT